jgi:hypothetical protein
MEYTVLLQFVTFNRIPTLQIDFPFHLCLKDTHWQLNPSCCYAEELVYGVCVRRVLASVYIWQLLQSLKYVWRYGFNCVNDLFNDTLNSKYRAELSERTTGERLIGKDDEVAVVTSFEVLSLSFVMKKKSNNLQQCNKILLFHIYMKLDMFRATHRP